ncbi:amidohydrolase family protein [Achromobacter aloeverae]
MVTRRGFLAGTASAGIMFCGCGLRNAARAAGPGPAKPAKAPPALRINGKRVKVIDTHAHCYFHDAIALMGDDAKKVLPPVRGVQEHFIPADDKTAVAGRLAAMDAMGVDLEVLSINPFWYGKDRDTADAICKIHNERFAALIHAYPERFAAFASLSLQFPDLAVQQLEHAVKDLGLRGAAIGGSVGGVSFSDPRFHPVWAKAQELDATLFIHPQSTPELAKRFQGNGWLSNVIGNPLDTTIALEHLIFEGTLDKFPRLKILAAHGGGYLGSYAARSDRSCYVSPSNCDPGIVLKHKPSEYIRRIHVDAMVFTPEALNFLISQVGIGQVVVGTDHPIPWEQHPVDQVLATPMSNAHRAAILNGNAGKLLNIKI